MDADPAGAPSSKRSALSGVRIPGTTLHGPRAVAILAIALYVFLFIALNNDHVKVNFVFFSFRTNELLGSLVIVALGFVAGYVIRGRRLDRSATDSTAREQAGLKRLRQENAELKRDLARKDKALAETTALLVLKKKAQLLWGQGEDS